MASKIEPTECNGQHREEGGDTPSQPLAVFSADSRRSDGRTLRTALRNGAQLQLYVVRRLPALIRIFGQAGANELLERGRSQGLNTARRRRI